MRVNIPYINNSNKVIDNKQSITLIGANGAGKTRMSVWIENNNVFSSSLNSLSFV